MATGPVKVVLVGAPGVGKATLLQRFQSLPILKQDTREHVRAVDCTLPPLAPLTVEFHVVACGEDTSLPQCCFSNAIAIVFMFSVQDHSSIDALRAWLDRHGDRTSTQLNPKYIIFIFGNKCDRNPPMFPWRLRRNICSMESVVKSKYRRTVDVRVPLTLEAQTLASGVTDSIPITLESESENLRVHFRHVKDLFYKILGWAVLGKPTVGAANKFIHDYVEYYE